MIRLFNLFVVMLIGWSSNNVFAAEGLIKHKSAYDVSTTADRLTAVLKTKGMTIFTQVNHTAGAKKVGLDLKPSQVIIFGNPKLGTLLMQCGQTAAIDLPQKALIYQDDQGQTWLSYNDPDYLQERHGLKQCDKPLKKIKAALANFAKAATQK